MRIDIKSTVATQAQKSCLIIGVFANNELSASGIKIDQTSAGALKKTLKKSGFQAKIGESIQLLNVTKTMEQILVLGLGERKDLSPYDFRKIILCCAKSIENYRIVNALCYLTDIEVGKQTEAWKVKQIVENLLDGFYRFDVFKSKKEAPLALKNFTIHVDKRNLKECQKGLKQGSAVASGMSLTKNLGNLPSNICTPGYFATTAKALARTDRAFAIKILDEKEMHRLKMGALLAVAQGSAEPPHLVVIHYRGATDKKKAPIIFVGKGVTFDTGGNSIKPADSMVGMKYDMCGAATVLGVMKTAAELKLPLNIIGVMPLVENMPGGNAYKPEDIVTSMSGQTIEIISTDAEGRLILADALTYCEQFKPALVIDIATLTGAAVIALGFHTTAVLSNEDALAQALIAAGTESNDRAWQLPLFEVYQEQIRSPFADISNVGGRPAGVITAACFLSRFAKKFRWAHLDVAGTAAMMMGTYDRKATGRPIPLLTQFLLNYNKKHATN